MNTDKYLLEYLKGHRKSSKLFFMGRMYNNGILKDLKNRFFNNNGFGRETLVNEIISSGIGSDIIKLSVENNLESVYGFLRDIETKIKAMKSSTTYQHILNHYDAATVKAFRYFLILKHQQARNNVRVGQKPLVSWRGLEVDLSDEKVQIEIYNYMYENCPDPFVTRLALAPQFWSYFKKLDIDNFIFTVISNYKYFMNQKKFKPNYDVFMKSYAHAVKKLQGVIDPQVYEMYALTWRYCKNLITNHGIYFRIDQRICKDIINCEVDERIFTSQWVIDAFSSISITKFRNALRYGVISNPIDILFYAFTMGNTESGTVFKHTMRYLDSMVDYVDRFKFDRIWNEKG